MAQPKMSSKCPAPIRSSVKPSRTTAFWRSSAAGGIQQQPSFRIAAVRAVGESMQYRFRAARDELKYHATPVDPATTAGHPTRFRDAIYIACRVERENAKSVSATGGRQS